MNVQFLNDGRARGLAAIRAQVRSQVNQEFFERLETATLWQRYRLRWQMKREIQQRVKRLVESMAPPDALY